MGWIAITKDLEVIKEGGEVGRPVQAGEEGNLSFILQEDFGHKVAIDLKNGAILIDYDDWAIVDNDIQIYNTKAVLYICDEIIIVGELFNVTPSEVNEEGWYTNTFSPLIWRPIWFTRVTNGIPTKVIGAQTTLPQGFERRNVKKMVSIFETGILGID